MSAERENVKPSAAETGSTACGWVLSADTSAEGAGSSEAGEVDPTGCTGAALEYWNRKMQIASTASPPPSTMRQVDRGLWAGDAGAAEESAGACSSRILWATSSGVPSSAMAWASFSGPAASR